MLTVEAHIQTEHASRYLVQLCRHANSINHKGRHLHADEAQPRTQGLRVEWTDTDATLSLSWGKCTLKATPDTLAVRAEAVDEENLQRLQELIARDLERFGKRDHLKVAWQPQEQTAPADPPSPASGVALGTANPSCGSLTGRT